MTSTITVSTATSFVSGLEAAFKDAVSGFEGFGSNIGSDIAAGTADVKIIANSVLAAFTASGNGEAAILAPLINVGLGILTAIESAAGWTATPSNSNTPPATPAAPVATAPAKVVTPAAPSTGSDGLGDNDADTGAL